MKDHYSGPHTQQGSLVTNIHLDLLHIYVITDLSKDTKKMCWYLLMLFLGFKALIIDNQ